MTDRPIAASPWEVEAGRRRDVIGSEVAAAREAERSHPGHELMVVAQARRLLRSLTSGSQSQSTRQAGRLNQKRV